MKWKWMKFKGDDDEWTHISFFLALTLFLFLSTSVSLSLFFCGCRYTPYECIRIPVKNSNYIDRCCERRQTRSGVLRQAKAHHNKCGKTEVFANTGVARTISNVTVTCKNKKKTSPMEMEVKRERGVEGEQWKKKTIRCGRVEIMENDIRKSNSNKILGA